jgi:hypothetical protein
MTLEPSPYPPDARLCRDARSCDGGVRQELAAGMTKKRRVYKPHILKESLGPSIFGRTLMPANACEARVVFSLSSRP